MDPLLSEAMQPWWEDPETKRWMGGYPPSLALSLANDPPTEFRGRKVIRRVALAATVGRKPVALVDFELYENGTAGTGIIVDPSRRGRNIGPRVLEMLARSDHIEGVRELFAGIDPENTASIRCFEKAGFIADSQEPNEEGMLYFRRSVNDYRTPEEAD